MTPTCRDCGTQNPNELPTQRWTLGYRTCKPCGDIAMRNRIRTIVPMHKSNYFLCTNLDDLHGINNKGGIVK